MFDKFLKKVEKFSDLAQKAKIVEKNNEFNAINKSSIDHERKPSSYNQESTRNYENNSYSNKRNNFQQKSFKKEYPDDGSHFCSYATGGNTLICYKNNQKLEISLAGINHPDKNHFLAKRANYFLNDLVKKKKIILKEIDNNLFEAFLLDNPNQSINQLMIDEGFHSSIAYGDKQEKTRPFEKFKNNAVDENLSETNSVVEKKLENKTENKKKNFAYGLFAKDADTFEAMFNNKKITCKLHNFDISNYSNETKKKIKNIIYEFVSKKSIILNIEKEEDNIFYVFVTNKENENLHEVITSKNFKTENSNKVSNEPVNSNNVLEDNSESEWGLNNDDTIVDSSDEKSNSTNEIDIPEVSNIPKMFQNKPKSDSPFSRLRKNNIVNEEIKENPKANLNEPIHSENENSQTISDDDWNFMDDDTIVDSSDEKSNSTNEIDIPEVSNIPKMFQNKPKSDSPFSRLRKNNIVNEEITENPEANLNEPVKKKLSFGKR